MICFYSSCLCCMTAVRFKIRSKTLAELEVGCAVAIGRECLRHSWRGAHHHVVQLGTGISVTSVVRGCCLGVVDVGVTPDGG